MRVPDRWQVVGKVLRAEPRLRVDVRAVVVWRVDEPARHVQLYGCGTRVQKVASPPVPIITGPLDALHKDHNVRVDRQDGVPCALSSQAPISGGVAATP